MRNYRFLKTAIRLIMGMKMIEETIMKKISAKGKLMSKMMKKLSMMSYLNLYIKPEDREEILLEPKLIVEGLSEGLLQKTLKNSSKTMMNTIERERDIIDKKMMKIQIKMNSLSEVMEFQGGKLLFNRLLFIKYVTNAE